MSIFRCCASLAVLSLLLVGVVQAESLTIEAKDMGYYSKTTMPTMTTVSHVPDNQYYIAGKLWEESSGVSYTVEYRNFFVFDLSSVADATITSAKLSLNTLWTSEGTETFELYNVSTSVSELTTPPSDSDARNVIFNDLAEGTVYATESRLFGSGDDIKITLNGDFRVAAGSANGLFAIGGALTTLSDSTNNQFVFDARDLPLPTPTLTVEFVKSVPEPGTFVLLLVGAAATLAFSRKRLWRRPR